MVLFVWRSWVSWKSRVSWSWHVESIEIVVFCIAFLRFALVVVVHPTQFNFSTCTNLLYVDEFKRINLWLEVLVVKQEEHTYWQDVVDNELQYVSNFHENLRDRVLFDIVVVTLSKVEPFPEEFK